jgi:LemA protein
MKHERETLEAVIAARNSAVTANTRAAVDPTDALAVKQMSQAEGALASSLGKMFALSEAYPDLKANQNMMQLTEELTSTENRIAFARQAFNDNVTEYNTSLEQFPGSVIANMFAFKLGELLQVIEAPEERKAVKVSF